MKSLSPNEFARYLVTIANNNIWNNKVAHWEPFAIALTKREEELLKLLPIRDKLNEIRKQMHDHNAMGDCYTNRYLKLVKMIEEIIQ